jgi:hypothetical protein
MLSTGIKSPIGIKVSGTVLSDIDATAQSIEAVAKPCRAWCLPELSDWKAGVTLMWILTGKKLPVQDDSR